MSLNIKRELVDGVWRTIAEEETAGGGGGSQDLEAVLTLGNDAGGNAIENVADGVNPTDVATVGQLTGAQGLDDVLSTGNDADGGDINNVGSLAAGGVVVTGKPGADEDVSYQSGTLSGPPVSGTWEVLDVVPSADGEIHICTVAGSPGTWVTVSGGGGGGGGAAEPVRAQDTSYRNGREWWTNFASATADAIWATPTNLTYGTDGGLPAVSPTVDVTITSFFLKDFSVKDFEVMLKWRASPDGSSAITDISSIAVGRRLDGFAQNEWWGQVALAVGANQAQIHSYRNTADATSAGATGIDNTDSTTYRWTKFRVTGDIGYLKTWFVDEPEPDWMVIRRLRPPLECSGSTTANDNQDFGTCGFYLYRGGIVQEVRITELVRMDSNLLVNPGPTHIDSTDGWPVCWYPTVDEGGGDTADIVEIEDPFGDTVPVFHLVKVGVTQSCFWTQDLWSAGPNSFLTRNSPHPQVTFPRAVEVIVWSKGNNVVDAGNLASALVAYQYNLNGDILNDGDLFYYRTLGPNGNAAVGSTGGKGDGTWNWTQSVWRMPFAGAPETIARLRVDVGLHDLEGTGELWLTKPVLRPVP